MEFKKKTIIWEDNNEPPKNYIGVKSDGNAYEFNHTTRQGEKTMSSNGSGDDGEGGSGSNINTFFQLATIQPNRYIVVPPDSNTLVPIDIENLDLNAFIDYTENEKSIEFFYSKEELSKLGFSLEELEALECFTDIPTPVETNSIQVDDSIIRDGFIISSLNTILDDTEVVTISVDKILYSSANNYYIMRYAYGDNNNYTFISINKPVVDPT